MARNHISNDPSGRIIVSFPYDSLLVAKVKTIEGSRDGFLVAVDLIKNNVDVAAGIMSGGRFKLIETSED
jgi:hypothetical protein